MATPYRVKEELGDYNYEITFATLDEMNAWLKANGPQTYAQVKRMHEHKFLSVNEIRARRGLGPIEEK